MSGMRGNPQVSQSILVRRTQSNVYRDEEKAERNAEMVQEVHKYIENKTK